MTWYDLSPMRPDDYAKTRTRRWMEAVACRTAFEDGMRDAAREGETYQQQRQQSHQA